MKDMELKSVLHFYLGCDCEIQPFDIKHKAKLVGVNYPTDEILSIRVFVKTEGNFAEVLYGLNECKFQLLLRPLSDMTEEEAQTYSKQTVESLVDSRDLKTHVFCPSLEDIPKLLSKGFDLFNLIPSGQALNSKSI